MGPFGQVALDHCPAVNPALTPRPTGPRTTKASLHLTPQSSPAHIPCTHPTHSHTQAHTYHIHTLRHTCCESRERGWLFWPVPPLGRITAAPSSPRRRWSSVTSANVSRTHDLGLQGHARGSSLRTWLLSGTTPYWPFACPGARSCDNGRWTLATSVH